MPGYSDRGPKPTRAVAKLRAVLGVALLVVLGGCVTSQDQTGSTAAAALPASPADLRAYAAEWGKRHDADPSNTAAAIAYARALRGLTQYAQAAAVLETTAIRNPRDLQVLAAYGKALGDAGRLKEAAAVLARAHTPEHPDWTILSAQGAVADQMGDHAAALDYYDAALKISPGEPMVLSNQGLSYALDKHLSQAEDCLRQAASSDRADARVRQNLALVLALQGKFAEAEAVSRRDLSPADATASVEAIRGMIAQSDTWSAIGTSAPVRPRRVTPARASGSG